MALSNDWTDRLLKYEATLEPPSDIQATTYGNISRACIDGTLVVFDPDDPPSWLTSLLTKRDEDGNVERQEKATV